MLNTEDLQSQLISQLKTVVKVLHRSLLNYFLSSIGTCAGIYVLSFCQQRNIPTDKIRLIQRMEDTPDGKMVGKITIEIKLPSEFPEKYRKAIVSSANLCAVKKHLEKPPKFSIITTRM